MLERDVVRVVTPGTLIEEDILDEKATNYLASVYLRGDAFGLAWSDISTGEFCVYEYAGEDWRARLSDVLSSVRPSEFVCNEDFVGAYASVPYFRVGRQTALLSRFRLLFPHRGKEAERSARSRFARRVRV